MLPSLSSLPPELLFGVAGLLVILGLLFLARGLTAGRAAPPLPPAATDESLHSGILMEGAAVTLAPADVPNGLFDRFDRWLDRSVRWSGLTATPLGAVALMILLAVAATGGLFLWKGQLGLAAAGGLLALLAPLATIAVMQRRHRRTLRDQMPDALYLMASALRAGQTIEQAIDLYAQRGNKPLAQEFEHTAGLLRLGWSPTAALQATAARVGLVDFDLLASTVGLYTQTGGNLALMMDRLAASTRDRNQFRAQFAAQTAQARLVAMFVGGAAPVFLIAYALFEPEYVQAFFQSARGWATVTVCALMELAGVIWVWRLMKVEY